jgi:hypothetical protein
MKKIEKKLCICCCKTSIRPVSEFAPGHDGRVTGYFIRIDRGVSMPDDFGSSVAKMWQEWNRLDRPGGIGHPILMQAAQFARHALCK